MNDFSELENELKKLRPAQPSAELAARIDAVFTKADSNQTTDPHVPPPLRFGAASTLSLSPTGRDGRAAPVRAKEWARERRTRSAR